MKVLSRRAFIEQMGLGSMALWAAPQLIGCGGEPGVSTIPGLAYPQFRDAGAGRR